MENFKGKSKGKIKGIGNGKGKGKQEKEIWSNIKKFQNIMTIID